MVVEQSVEDMPLVVGNTHGHSACCGGIDDGDDHRRRSSHNLPNFAEKELLLGLEQWHSWEKVLSHMNLERTAGFG